MIEASLLKELHSIFLCIFIQLNSFLFSHLVLVYCLIKQCTVISQNCYHF